MKIKNRLILIVALPLLCLTIFSASNLAGSLQHQTLAKRVVSGIDDASVSSHLIHALQRERGASAGYIGSRGKVFGDQLRMHRKGVDEAATQYRLISENIRARSPQQASKIDNALSQLSTMRSQVSNQNIALGNMAQFYTSMINQLIAASEFSVSQSTDSKIGKRGQAYMALMRAKEAAGLERAMGANGFGGGKFSGGVYKKFTSLGAAQNVLIEEAQRYSGQEDAQAIYEFNSGAVSERVASFRKKAQDSIFGSEPMEKGLGDVWFAASTTRIDSMKVLEDRLAASLLTTAKAQVNSSNIQFYVTLILSIVTMGGSVGFALYSSRTIAAPLGGLNRAMKAIEKGDYKTAVKSGKRSDEIGDMARTLIGFRDKLSEAKEQNRLATFKSAAFEGSSSAMMMIDRDFNVVFVNKATEQLLDEKAHLFREMWPSFSTDNIVGTCIDIFHKDPAHQRKMLSDPSNLPYRTDINLGDLKIALNVSAVHNSAGEYVGNVLEWDDVTDARLNSGIVEVIQNHQATIEFTLDGTILNANENFLKTVGYSLDEIKGKHHSMFVKNDYKRSREYREFWEDLARGKVQSGKFEGVGSGGAPIWIDAAYNPITDRKGKPFKVVKIATDVTERELSAQKRREMEAAQAEVVQTLSVGLKKLSDGDLTNFLNTAFSEEYEEIRANYNMAVEKLAETINGVIDNSSGIRTSAAEVTQAADDLSQRTENQAATLEETAAALDELTASVKSAASGADKANRAVSDARHNAESSGAVVKDAVTAMSEIEKSSTQISQIIGVIDDIAFQTNLLALNAGVEAARAGDAGRGFAVVASEVRALAQRSSDAAKEIKGLISTSSEHVEKGVDLVGQAGNALEDIVNSVADISTLVSDIATSAQEQSTGITEINTAINQMDQGTQQNAAMVEETTAASHTLSTEAQELVGLVQRFKTDQSAELLNARKVQTLSASPAPARSAPAPKETVGEQQERIAAFAASGSAAAVDLNSAPAEDEDNWEEF